jgi:mitochondrial import receptor subunit TOM22
MVKVEIVEEKDTAGNSPYASDAASVASASSESLSSVSSELSADETFIDRVSALVDIVPPTTRHAISTRVSKTASFFKAGGKLAGNLVWVLTTSALLIGLPLAMSLEDEAKIVEQEKEMLAQQQGAQVRPSVAYIFNTLEIMFPHLFFFFSLDDGCLWTTSTTATKGPCTPWFLILPIILIHIHAHTHTRILIRIPLTLLSPVYSRKEYRMNYVRSPLLLCEVKLPCRIILMSWSFLCRYAAFACSTTCDPYPISSRKFHQDQKTIVIVVILRCHV